MPVRGDFPLCLGQSWGEGRSCKEASVGAEIGFVWSQRMSYVYLFGPLFLSLFTHRLCGILEGGVPGHLSHYFPPQSGPGHKPHGAGRQPGLLPIHYSLSCQAGTGIKRNFCEALPSPNSVPGLKRWRIRRREHILGGEPMLTYTPWWWKGCLCLRGDCQGAGL